MGRVLLSSGALLCLAAASCANSASIVDAGRSGQSGGSAGKGDAGGGSPGGTGGGGAGVSGGAGGSSNDAPGLDTPGGVDSGAVGSGGAGGSGTDAAGGDAGPGNWPAKGRTGMKSAGCGMAPVGAVSNTFTNHKISIPACAACTVPNCPSNCIAPPFVPGGRNAQIVGQRRKLSQPRLHDRATRKLSTRDSLPRVLRWQRMRPHAAPAGRGLLASQAKKAPSRWACSR